MTPQEHYLHFDKICGSWPVLQEKRKKELASYDLENKKSHERDIAYGEDMIEGKRIDSMDEAVHEL